MQQLEKSQDPRFDHKNISVQSNMRYNQLFSHTFKITMIFNSSIHAGDIFVDIRKLDTLILMMLTVRVVVYIL